MNNGLSPKESLNSDSSLFKLSLGEVTVHFVDIGRIVEHHS
jgi:hypothetical protein